MKSQQSYVDQLQITLSKVKVANQADPYSTESEWRVIDEEPDSPGLVGQHPGQVGRDLAHETQTAAVRWQGELDRALSITKADLDAAKISLEEAIKQHDVDTKRLALQREGHNAVLRRIEAYGNGLEIKSPRAVAASPRRRTSFGKSQASPVSPAPSPPSPPSRRTKLPNSTGGTIEEEGQRSPLEDRNDTISAQMAYLKKAENGKVLSTTGPDNPFDPRINPDVKPRWQGQKRASPTLT